MSLSQPRLMQTFLLDGTIEGARIIELSDSAIKAFVIPRLQLNSVKGREELARPALYFLVSSGEQIGYVGESENFYHRIKNHDQNKEFWDVAIAIVSTTNNLEKGDVKYLESLAVERAKSGSMQIENKTVPVRNNVHEFKLHILQKILDDTQLVLTSLGYDIFSSPENKEELWHCVIKHANASAQFRGDKFVLLTGSYINKSYAPGWGISSPKALAERQEIITKFTKDHGDVVELTENVAFTSPAHASNFVTGRNSNAWITWKNNSGQTMDEVMRKS